MENVNFIFQAIQIAFLGEKILRRLDSPTWKRCLPRGQGWKSGESPKTTVTGPKVRRALYSQGQLAPKVRLRLVKQVAEATAIGSQHKIPTMGSVAEGWGPSAAQRKLCELREKPKPGFASDTGAHERVGGLRGKWQNYSDCCVSVSESLVL